MTRSQHAQAASFSLPCACNDLECVSKQPIQLIATDIDGTLIDAQHQLPAANRYALLRAKAAGLHLALVTGRSMETARMVVTAQWPFTHLVFSTGAGVATWPSLTLLHEVHFNPTTARSILQLLLAHHLSFTVHAPIPDSHLFLYHQADYLANTDFNHRLQTYRQHATPLPHDPATLPWPPSLFLTTIPPSPDLYQQVAQMLMPYGQVTRTTSPIDHRSIWVELYPEGVSKASGLLWLTKKLGIPPEGVAVIGNDYNDLPMLKAFPAAFIIADGHPDLQQHFQQVAPCKLGGLAEAIYRCLGGR